MHKVIEFQRVVRKGPRWPKAQADKPVPSKPSTVVRVKESTPSSSGLCVIVEAKRDLRSRLVERKGVLFLDGRVITIPELLREANRDRKRRGQPLLGKNPERWL